MPYPTSWNLSRYFYSGLDDPKLDTDIKNILPLAQKFAEKYEHTFHTFKTPEEIQ